MTVSRHGGIPDVGSRFHVACDAGRWSAKEGYVVTRAGLLENSSVWTELG